MRVNSVSWINKHYKPHKTNLKKQKKIIITIYWSSCKPPKKRQENYSSCFNCSMQHFLGLLLLLFFRLPLHVVIATATSCCHCHLNQLLPLSTTTTTRPHCHCRLLAPQLCQLQLRRHDLKKATWKCLPHLPHMPWQLRLGDIVVVVVSSYAILQAAAVFWLKIF